MDITGKFWVDPPKGWCYGFPKVYDPSKDGELRGWLESQGFPEDGELDYVRMWHAGEDDE